MGNTCLKQQRLSKKSPLPSKIASASKKLTLKISKPKPVSNGRLSGQLQASGLFMDEVDELEDDMDLFVSKGFGEAEGVADDEDVLRSSGGKIEMLDEKEEEEGSEEEEDAAEDYGEEMEQVQRKEEEDRSFDMPFHVPLGTQKDAQVKTLDLCGTCGTSGPCLSQPSTLSEATSTHGMMGDPAALGAALVSFFQHANGAPSQVPQAPEVSKEDDGMDTMVADELFPSIHDWLVSVQDTHPGLLKYADTLEERQLTHLNQLESQDMSVAALVSLGMGFLDVSAFLCMG